MLLGNPLLALDRRELAKLLHAARRLEVVEDRLVPGEALEPHDLLGQEPPVLAEDDVTLARNVSAALVERHGSPFRSRWDRFYRTATGRGAARAPRPSRQRRLCVGHRRVRIGLPEAELVPLGVLEVREPAHAGNGHRVACLAAELVTRAFSALMSSTSKYTRGAPLVAVGAVDRAARAPPRTGSCGTRSAPRDTPGTPSRTASPRTRAPSPCRRPGSRDEPSGLPCLSSRLVSPELEPQPCHSIRRRTSAGDFDTALDLRRCECLAAAEADAFRDVRDRGSACGFSICAGNGAEGARTPDLLAASQTLSQLSYGPGARQSSADAAARPQAVAASSSTDGTSLHSSSSR